MTDWPDNDETLDFSDLTEPIVDLIRQAYWLNSAHSTKKGLVWRGPSLPKSLAATCHPYDEALSAERLRYNDSEQGIDPLMVIVGIAVQLGIEQGRRMNASKVSLTQQIESLLEEVRRTSQ